jgi:hypothetical protein
MVLGNFQYRFFKDILIGALIGIADSADVVGSWCRRRNIPS